MADDWNVSDDEMDSWVEEWAAVDRAADDYLAERIAGVRDVLDNDDARWVSAVMALQHADWLGLVIGAVRRSPGCVLDAVIVQADIDELDDVDGEIEDPEGHLSVLDMALSHLSPLWQDLGVLAEDNSLTARGVWGLPKALHHTWTS